jgi:hypothetical protein
MKKIFKIVLVGLLAFLLLCFIVKQSIKTIKSDTEFIKNVTNEESLEKMGEKTGDISNELTSRKDAFMKGYKATKKDTINN